MKRMILSFLNREKSFKKENYTFFFLYCLGIFLSYILFIPRPCDTLGCTILPRMYLYKIFHMIDYIQSTHVSSEIIVMIVLYEIAIIFAAFLWYCVIFPRRLSFTVDTCVSITAPRYLNFFKELFLSVTDSILVTDKYRKIINIILELFILFIFLPNLFAFSIGPMLFFLLTSDYLLNFVSCLYLLYYFCFILLYRFYQYRTKFICSNRLCV